MVEGNKTLKNSKRSNSSVGPCLLVVEDPVKALDWPMLSCDVQTYVIPGMSSGTAESVLQHLFHLFALKQ